MRVIPFAVVIGLALAQPGFPEQQCPTKGTDGQYHTVEEGLQWCDSNSSGFNEGASCGLNALSGAGLSGLPGAAAQPILGNSWTRTNMMGATKVAFKAGKRDAAINAAICCQIHNPHMDTCLKSNRAAVSAWLELKTK